MRYVAYFRVSTKVQGRSGLGLDAQRDAVQRHVAGRGAELVSEFTEIESGRNDNRPQLALAIELAVRTKSVLLIAKLDRLARRVHFISSLMMHEGLEIEACDLPAANKFTMHIMAAVAEQEAQAISERTKAALAQAALRGKKFGFAHEKNEGRASQIARQNARISKIRADLRAAEIGHIIDEMRGQKMTFPEIALRFSKMGIPMDRKPAKRGIVVWSQARIKQIYYRYTFIGPTQHHMVSLPPPDPD